MSHTQATNAPLNKPAVFSWCLFDWASNGFPIIITTFIFSNYFAKAIAPSVDKGTAWWGWTVAISGIVIAILAPILGSIIDQMTHRKRWIGCLMLITLICTFLLFWAAPHPSWVWYALILFAIATIAYELTFVFYNSFLPIVAPRQHMGKISGWGWGSGYIGGIIALAIALYFVDGHWITHTELYNVRSTTILVVLWYIIFAWPFFVWVKEKSINSIVTESTTPARGITTGLKELVAMIKSLKDRRMILWFLIARLIYTDALIALFTFGGLYAGGTFGFTFTDIILFGLALNILAGLGSFVFGWIDDWIGAKTTIIISLVCLLIFGIVILSIHSSLLFWIFGCLLAIFVGPVQAASRSFFAHHIEPKELNKMFGLYALSGKITSFVGPFFIATLTDIYSSQRIGMITIPVLIAIGLVMMVTLVKES